MNEKFQKLGFYPADILLPKDADMTKWAVVACDQFTSSALPDGHCLSFPVNENRFVFCTYIYAKACRKGFGRLHEQFIPFLYHSPYIIG